MPRVELTGGFYEDSALQFSAQTCVNMYPEYPKVENGKSNGKLKSRQGLNIISTVQTGADARIFKSYTASNKRSFVAAWRSSASNKLRLFETFVSGGSNVEYTSTSISGFPEKIELVDNGIVLSILVTYTNLESDVYFFNFQTDTLTRCTDPDLPTNIISQTYKDSYFLYADNLNSRVYVSDNFASDPTSFINALDFTTVESDPDKIEMLDTLNNEVVVFGSKTIEFYYNSGNVDFPFERNSGATINVGISARRSLRKASESLYFIGKDSIGEDTVYVLNGYSVKRISTIPIDFKITDILVDTGSSIGFAYREKGHEFYCINNSDIGETLVYDISVGTWHTRTSEGSNLPIVDVNFGLGLNVFWGDYINEYVGTYSFYGLIYDYLKQFEGKDFLRVGDSPVNIDRSVVLPHLTVENKNIQYNSFEMDIQKGVGNVGDPDPEITLSVSRDGGMTYGNPRTLKMGASGAYKGRVKANMLGMARDAVFKIESSAPVQQEWFTAYVDYEVESE
jgi:hypothetical protein